MSLPDFLPVKSTKISFSLFFTILSNSFLLLTVLQTTHLLSGILFNFLTSFNFILLSTNENIDPVGSCVGQKGVRIQNIINELNGEKIDVIEWNL